MGLTALIRTLNAHHPPGSSQCEEVISYWVSGGGGWCPWDHVLCPSCHPKVITSLTQNKRWLHQSMPTYCSNFKKNFSVFKGKKHTFPFCVNSNSPMQLRGAAPFGSPRTALCQGPRGMATHQLSLKEEAWEVPGARVGADSLEAPPHPPPANA